MERTVLAVDIGTSSLKASLIDVGGTVVASARIHFPESPRVARDWVVALGEAARALKAAQCASQLTGSAAHGLERPAAIVISGNGPTLVSVNNHAAASFSVSAFESVPASAFTGDGVAGAEHSVATGAERDSGPVLMWNDPVGADAGVNADKTEPSGESIFVPRLAAYRRLFAAEWESARYILSGPEYLIYALTGNAVTILPEPRYERAYWTAESLSRAGLAGAPLAPFVTTGAIVGTVARGWSGFALSGGTKFALSGGDGIALSELDDFLSPGIPVVAGGPDFIVALVGTGTLKAGTACDRAGTSEGLNVCTASRVAHEGIRTLPSVTGGLWNASYLLPETGAAFHAWRLGTGQNARGYPEIMAEIESSPIIPPRGTPPHAGRAMVERIGFSVRRGIETLERATGFRPTYVLSGGQARNEIWNQMKADITGAPFALTATPDGELMGDAVIGFAALGDYKTPEEAAERMVRITKRYEPDRARHAQYTEKYLAHENP